MQNETILRKQIVEVGKRLYNFGFVVATDGNISARLGENRFLITPSGVCKGTLTENDLIVIDSNGNVLDPPDKKPSSEVHMHLTVYRERPEINSVCHAHPPYSTAFAVTGQALTQAVLQEVVLTLGSIPLVEYATTGTKELAEKLVPLLDEHDAFLLANHGVLTIGVDVLSAYFKMETVEHFARILSIARGIGDVQLLTREDIDALIEKRKNYGITVKANAQARDD